MKTPKEMLVALIDEKKFWEGVNINKPDECWEWRRGKTGKGYGVYCFSQKDASRSKRMFLSHRIAWSLKNGPIPKGLFIMHKCDNPACCNPSHLSPGTSAENRADCVIKKRHAFGERSMARKYPELIPYGTKHPLAKLDANKVKQIRLQYIEGRTLKYLSNEFGVCVSKVHQIIKRKSWVHVI